MNNPYASPDAVLSEPATGNAPYQPKFFSVHGRIGRLRYLAYSFTAMFVLSFAIGALAGVLMPALSGGKAGDGAGLIVLALINIPLVAIGIIITKRRFNDLDLSGWWSLLMFVPLINLIAWLYLMFGSGTEGPNRFGPPPSKNSVLVMIGGLMLPIVFVVGILAAIAIPAYQQYVQRANAAAAQQR